jgi:hypothetical protein
MGTQCKTGITDFARIRSAKRQNLLCLQRSRLNIFRPQSARWTKLYCATLFHAFNLYLPSCVTLNFFIKAFRLAGLYKMSTAFVGSADSHRARRTTNTAHCCDMYTNSAGVQRPVLANHVIALYIESPLT